MKRHLWIQYRKMSIIHQIRKKETSNIMSDTAIRIENLKKQYRLGAIGGRTLNAELQSWWARKRG